MEKYKLNNGIEIPALGLGVFRIEDNKLAQETVESALSVGYRHIDTAMIYGNEEAVGHAIKNSGIARNEIFITTKLWNDDQRSEKVDEAIDASLKRLGLDYVDLYLVHWPVKGYYANVWKKMEKVYEDKKVKSIGVSNYNEHHLEDLLTDAKITPAVNQIECHPYFSQAPLIKYCLDKGIRPEAWAPLGAGKSDVLDNDVIKEVARRYNKTSAQVILRWHLDRGLIAIPKSSHKERQIENITIADFHLTADDIKLISSLNKDKRQGSDPDNFNF